MARINIEDKWFDDPRRLALIQKIGATAVDGSALQIWRVAQNYFKAEALVPREIYFACPHAQDFLDVKLAEERADGVYVKGSNELFRWLRERQTAGGEGGRRSATKRKQNQANDSKQQLIQPSDSVSDSVSSSSSSSFSDGFPEMPAAGGGVAVWEAYSKAYEAVHGCPPIRDKMANVLCKKFAEKLPAAAAPEVAAFYVRHKGAFYVQRKHPLEMMVADAGKLHTEWKTGNVATRADANQGELRQAVVQRFRDYEKQFGGGENG